LEAVKERQSGYRSENRSCSAVPCIKGHELLVQGESAHEVIGPTCGVMSKGFRPLCLLRYYRKLRQHQELPLPSGAHMAKMAGQKIMARQAQLGKNASQGVEQLSTT